MSPAKLDDDVRRRPLQTKLPPALIDAVTERARKLGMTRTAFVERALEAAVGGSGRVAPRRPSAAPEAGSAAAPVDAGEARAAAFRAAAARRRG